MKQIKLPNRLQAIAELIDDEATVADIGTDHGYLPVYLALKEQIQPGTVKRIIASDNSEGSLAAIRRNAEKYGVADKIEIVCAPGLDRIGKNDVNTIIIAGVGGETIRDILQAAPWTVKECTAGKLKLILQPQTKLDVLREFLHNSGYKLQTETAVTDRGRAYTILEVSNQCKE